MKKYIPHSEKCLRFGISDDCPACGIEAQEQKARERNEHMLDLEARNKTFFKGYSYHLYSDDYPTRKDAEYDAKNLLKHWVDVKVHIEKNRYDRNYSVYWRHGIDPKVF